MLVVVTELELVNMSGGAAVGRAFRLGNQRRQPCGF